MVISLSGSWTGYNGELATATALTTAAHHPEYVDGDDDENPVDGDT